MKQSVHNCSYYVKKAQPEDEVLIRQLLRKTPMQGAVHVSLEREPSAKIAADVEGLKHDTVFVMDSRDDQILGMGSRSVRSLYFDGEVRSVGYLGQLRASPGRKGLKRLAAGFKGIEMLRGDDELAFDLTSIVEDNSDAVRMLERGLKGLPRYKKLSRLSTFVIPTIKKIRKNRHAVESATSQDQNQIVARLQSYLSQYQFSPYWDIEALESERLCNNLSLEDFLIIRNGDNISSCLAIWDQRAFKQVVINSYSYTLSNIRPFLNILLSVQGKPTLPKAPGELNFAYLSHMAVQDNDPAEFKDLVRRAQNVGAQRGFDYLVLGLTESHPLHKVFDSAFPHYRYTSTLYTVHWGEQIVTDDVNERIPHLEIAIL